MNYRSNLGCLWLLLLVLLLGGTPLLIGVLRLLAGFFIITILGGALLTWWIRRQAVLDYRRTRGRQGVHFVELLVALLVRVAEIDGQLDRREVSAIRRFFEQRLGYRGEQLLWIRDLIKETRRSTRSVDSLCAEITANYGLHERFIVVQVLAHVAEADGAITASEHRFIEQVATLLGLAPFAGAFGFDPRGWQTPTEAPGRSVDEALATLGLQRGAGRDEIKQAWRKLSMENHPDRVAHLGTEFRDLAEERMRSINAAYDVLKQAGRTA